jgi:hypothetical protein
MIDVKTTTVDPWRDAMVRVTFVLDGRETIVTEDAGRRPPNPVDRVMLLAARNHVQRRLAGIICSLHGESPSVIADRPRARPASSPSRMLRQARRRATRALEPLPGDLST